jgi:hypothetical protein
MVGSYLFLATGTTDPIFVVADAVSYALYAHDVNILCTFFMPEIFQLPVSPHYCRSLGYNYGM